MTNEERRSGNPKQHPVVGRLLQVVAVIVALVIMGIGGAVIDALPAAFQRSITLVFESMNCLI